MVTFLVDTGASRSLINRETYLKLNRLGVRNPTNVKLMTLTGEDIRTDGEIKLPIDKIGAHNFIIMPEMDNAGLLGHDFLEKFNVHLNFQSKVVSILSESFPMTLHNFVPIPRFSVSEVQIVDCPPYLNGVERHRVFRPELGHCITTAPLVITTEGPPIHQKPYRQALTKRKIVEEEISKMLKEGVIRPSSSPWASPVTLQPKKDGSIRFCIDYRKVNAVTVRDSHPIPNIQQLFDSLAGARIFSTLDLRSAYWQVDMAPEAIPKTAFCTSYGLYEFLRLPYGLKNAPSQFQRIMNQLLSKHLSKICLVYLDDVVIFSKTEAEHKQHLTTILDTINQANLTLKLKKCHFGKPQVELLGYVISEKGISPQAGKVEAIRNVPYPTDLKEVRSFLGMAGYYRQCIENFAVVASPLVNLTKKGELFRIGEEEKAAWDALKAALCSSQVMRYPDPAKPYLLYTDASQYAIGAILVQVDEEGVERPIQYTSKQLTRGQQKWSTIEREAFSIIAALKKLRPYLQGADFTILTDHKPLRSLFKCELKNSRCQRWAMQISEFNCTIQYRRGKHNVRADMLSRIRVPMDSVQETLTAHNFSEEQRSVFAPEWEEAETGESEDYVVEAGELYSIRLPYPGAVGYPRIVLPPSHRVSVIRDAHVEVGHRSLLPTLRRVQSFAVWPKMRNDIIAVLDQCSHCQGNRPNPPKAPLVITETPNQPFQKFGIDLVGPFHPSPYNNKYLLTVIDHLTGWAEAIPIANKTSNCVWQALYKEIFPRYGFPIELVTDQGLEFNSREIRECFAQLGIKHRRTSPGHPQTNGMVERFNQTLKHTLRKLVNNDTSAWEDRLAEAMMAYRISEHRGRGMSPFYCTFGFQPNVPEVSFEDSRFETLAEAQKLAYETQNAQKQYRFNRGPQSNRDLSVGDYVTIDNPEAVTLTHLRDGAWRVVSVRGKVIGCQKITSNALTPPGPVRHINIDRIRLVPPELDWTPVQPRPRRYRGPSDARTLTFANRTQDQYSAVPTDSPTVVKLVRKRKHHPDPESLDRERKQARIAVLKEVRDYFS
jgi:hypothetical protein